MLKYFHGQAKKPEVSAWGSRGSDNDLACQVGPE